MWGLIAGVLLAAGAVWLVLDPILRPRAPEAFSAGADPDDDLTPRAVALRALAEIEFDRATGKLSQTDYDALKARYTRDAAEAIRDAARPAAAPTAVLPVPPVPPVPPAAPTATPPAPAKPVIPLASRQPGALPGLVCAVHGPRNEPGAAFCSECGRRVGAREGDLFCGKCGSRLEPGARFCGRCGGRVAA